jgi:hypothetical protein
MHPHTFYSTLFSHERRDEIFVIMSFAPEFDDRWHRVIEPMIREDLGLKPKRVDYNNSGESIVHDILDGIAHARLVLADITSSPMKDGYGNEWPQRNGNVMWELGISHVMRLPDEVLVIRSDNDPSIFDLTQFRAFQYNPRDVVVARRFLQDLVTDRIKAVEQAATDHVRRCVRALDYSGWQVLSEALHHGGVEPPVIRTMGDVMGNMSRIPAIARLLEMGLLTTLYVTLTPELMQAHDLPAERLMRYNVTRLGRAVLGEAARKMGALKPDIQPLMQQIADEVGGQRPPPTNADQ